VVGSYNLTWENGHTTIYSGFLLMLIAWENSPSPLTAFFSKFNEKPQAEFFSLLLADPYGLGKETTTQRSKPMNKLAKILAWGGISLLMHTNPAFCAEEWIEHEFDATAAAYTFKPIPYTDEEGLLTTTPQRPTQGSRQSCEVYRGNPLMMQEMLLMSIRDRRQPVERVDSWPYSIHGQLETETREKTFGGSGTMVGPHHFLTAAHCVYNPQKMRGWPRSLTVRPALNDRSAAFGAVKATKVYLHQEWVESGGESSENDVALIVLERSIGNETGWAGLLALDNDSLRSEKVHVTGYPGDKGFKTMWTMEERFDHVGDELLSYRIDTSGGQSGGAIWIKKFATPYLVGVHTTGSTGRNFGVRLSQEKFLKILKLMEETGEILEERASTTVSRSARISTISRHLLPTPEERIYQLFYNGKLVYKPDPNSDRGKIELPIAALANPLEGKFNLSSCGDAGQYLSINTGYRKGKKAENANKEEIWFVPKFLVERDLATTASHFRPIMDKWTGPIGIFWTWSGFDNLGWFDYLVTQDMENISSASLNEHWSSPDMEPHPSDRGQYVFSTTYLYTQYITAVGRTSLKFHVHFVN